jgi:hypothetical protein
VDSSWLVVVSIVGYALAPFWAKWSNQIIARGEFPRPVHVAGVILLSLAALAIFYIGPWVLWAAILGRFPDVLYEGHIGMGAAILFGPGIVYQIVSTVGEVWKPSASRPPGSGYPGSVRFTWFGIVIFVAGLVIIAKAVWNVRNDPPGVIRPCVFCSPYVPYMSPPPPEPTR